MIIKNKLSLIKTEIDGKFPKLRPLNINIGEIWTIKSSKSISNDFIRFLFLLDNIGLLEKFYQREFATNFSFEVLFFLKITRLQIPLKFFEFKKLLKYNLGTEFVGSFLWQFSKHNVYLTKKIPFYNELGISDLNEMGTSKILDVLYKNKEFNLLIYLGFHYSKIIKKLKFFNYFSRKSKIKADKELFNIYEELKDLITTVSFKRLQFLKIEEVMKIKFFDIYFSALNVLEKDHANAINYFSSWGSVNYYITNLSRLLNELKNVQKRKVVKAQLYALRKTIQDSIYSKRKAKKSYYDRILGRLLSKSKNYYLELANNNFSLATKSINHRLDPRNIDND